MRRPLAVLLVLAGCLVWEAARAATSVVEVGWWSSSPFSEAPEGGLVVGQAPNGATGVSALRLDVGRGVTDATLVLGEAGGFAQEVAVVAVCRGTDDWSAVANGNLENAPEPLCANDPPTIQRGDGTWSGDVQAVLGNATGLVTVMLVPGESSDPTGTLGLGWEVQFDPPVFQATEVAAPPTPSTTPTPVSPAPPPVTAPARSGSGAGAGSAPPATTTTSAAPTTTTTAPAEVASDAKRLPRGGGLAPGDDEGRPWGQLGIIIALSAGVGAVTGGARWLALDGPLARVRPRPRS